MTTSVIETTRRISLQETSMRCAHIAKKFVDKVIDENEGETRREGTICIPRSQRQWAWKGAQGSKKMQTFIDSILHNYPIPSSILNENDADGITDYHIFDGRHRFETIWRFMNNKFQYKGTFFKDLSLEDQEKFKNREMPVTIAQNATSEQLADIFIRLNSGKALTDSDMFWAHRDSPLGVAVHNLIVRNERLSNALGGQDLYYRADRANWTGLVYGLSTRNPDNMTTSYIRIAEKDGLVKEIDQVFVRQGINALCELYELANAETDIPKKEQKRYKKLGTVNAFFLTDWMKAEPSNRKTIIRKWADLLALHRADETRDEVQMVLSVPGAQNLNSERIHKVIKRVNDFLETSSYEAEDGFLDGDDDDSQS